MSMTKSESAISVKSPSRIIDVKPAFMGATALFLVVALLRLYEQLFAWSFGIDSFSPDFQTYWMPLLKAASILSVVSAVGLITYLWRTRDRNLNAITPVLEIRRLVYLASWLLVFALALFWGLSFFTEQTAVWHMTAVRDTDFTPANIITFYIAYPIFAIIGCGAFFYAKTRIPLFARGYSLPFGVLVIGVFMTIPNVGLNEWGHTCWSMDENFAGPLHWGFVFFGWMALGIFGVVLQMLGRLRELLGKETVEALLRR